MNNSCPTVKYLLVLLPLAAVLIFNFSPQRAKGTRGKASPRSPFSHKVSSDVSDKARLLPPAAPIPVIIQLNDKASPSFEADVAKKSGHLTASLPHFNARVVEIPAKGVEELAARSHVDFISLDRQNISFGHISPTTGADAARLTSVPNTTGLDGTGIGIAVLDSGIDAT